MGARDSVRIGTWNCNLSFRSKVAQLARLDLDVAVIQECSEADWLAHAPPGALWFGHNPKKGLGVCSPRGTYAFEPLALDAPVYRWLVPLAASGPVQFSLIAAWSFNHRQPGVKRALWEALPDYASVFESGPTMVTGDLNNSVIWDTPRQPAFRRSIDWLSEHGMTSAYHSHTGAEHGAEPDATLWMYRHENRPYHIDYCFLPAAWLPLVASVEIGSYADWSPCSDHAPLVVELVPPLG